MIFAFALAAALIGLDQLTKYLAVQHLLPVQDIPLINGVLHLHYANNYGAVFGILSAQQQPALRWGFIVLTCLAVVAIIYTLYKRGAHMPWIARLALALVLAGAVGNLIDRVFRGYVVDFIYIKLINFAIFNVADMCITFGVILLSIYILFLSGEGQRAKPEPNHP